MTKYTTYVIVFRYCSTPSETKTTSRNHNTQAVTPMTTTTTTTTTGISALRNRFNSHSDGKCTNEQLLDL